MTPYEHLELHPDDDPEPRLPRHEPSPKRTGCDFILGVALVLALLAGSTMFEAAPRPGPSVEASVQSRQQVAPVTTDRTKAPLPLPAASTVSEPSDDGYGSGTPVAEPIRTSTPVSTVGTALYSASATWCAPTPTHCQSWGGNARFGAVHGFRFGDAPWWARVWRGALFADVLVVSYCACRGTDAAIDLSPAAFDLLAPLSRGRIAVAIEVLDWPVGDDPPPHPDDQRLRIEDGGPQQEEPR
jgi:hypothetical protein